MIVSELQVETVGLDIHGFGSVFTNFLFLIFFCSVR